MNQTAKRQTSKICQEVSLKWPQALPLALLRIRSQPSSKGSVTPYKILYGRPDQTPRIPGDMGTAGETDLKMYLISLRKTLEALRKYVVLTRSLALDTPVHQYPPGDFVCIRTWSSEPLQERWKGPSQGLLITDTAVTVGVELWIHHTREKKAPSWRIINRGPETAKLILKYV